LYLGDTRLVEVPSFQPVESCSIPPIPTSRFQLYEAVSGIVHGKILVCGGFDQLKSVSNCYKLDNGTWKPHHSLSTGRHDAAASINGEGWMMVSGGRADNTILASTEILTADAWVQGPPLPEPLQGHCQVTINGKILVAGGQIPDGDFSDKVYVLTGATWTTIQPMENGRAFHSCSIINNRVIAIGGWGAEREVETLDIEQNIWSKATGFTINFWHGNSVGYDDQVYAVNGCCAPGEVLRMAEDGSSWDTVADVGEWRVESDKRPFNQAVRVTKEMIGC